MSERRQIFAGSERIIVATRQPFFTVPDA